MEFTTISLVLVYLATLATTAVVHYPKVTEDNYETNIDNIRTIRNHEKIKKPGFNPAPFTYQSASQQDYLKQRYAEQQQVNVEEIARLRRKANSKNIHNIYQQSTLEHDPSSEPYDWQPFLSTAHRRHDRSSKEYIPLVVNTQKEKRDNTLTLNSESKQEDNKKPMSSHIIYVDPRILRKVFELKNQRKQIQSRSISIEQATLVDSNSLNEILNKNPHIQLESLRNILQDPNQRNRIFPVIEGPQPFQQKDHTPITERTVDVPNPRSKPNIQVNHDQPQDQQAHPQQHTQEDNDPVLTSIIPQQGQTITKEAFDQIQKQLEASSKYQVHDALFRAQQDAQAHVEAQHKAIEQAQRAILESVQKQLQDAGGSPEALRYVQEQIPQFKSSEKNSEDAPQALRLVQENVPQYVTHINVPMSVPVYPTPLPKQVVSPVHQVTIPTSNVRIQSYKPTSLPDYIPKNVAHGKEQNIVREQPQLPKFKIIKITPSTTQVPKHFFIQPQIKQNLISQKPTAAQQSLAQKIEHYAPNHLHQAVAQLQAEKVLLAQVQSHNNAIMNSKKGGNRYVGQKSQIDYASADKVQDKEAHGSANAYQHIVLEPKQKSREKQIHHEEPQDENDDLQYAAKYAFGYRIKDNEEEMDFGHQEKRSGRSAEGSYQVLLPDGRRQKVDYYADDTGYHAKVTYENVATHK